MNVYDFDETIYDGDSTVDFVKYSIIHQPKVLIYFPKIAIYGLLFVLKLIPKLKFKETLYGYFKGINDMYSFVEEYVNKHLSNIKQWYLDNQKEDDVIISASPEFIVKNYCEKIGIKYVMASKVNKYTGKYDGDNCWGEEKVRRFYEMFPNGKIDNFYSDSYSDTPLAKLATKAYIVKKNELKEW